MMKILLVDDEEELVATIAERLSLRGFEAAWALSGAEAIEKTKTQQYDVAVLDVKMPKMGGLELKKRLSSKWPDMKFIFLTGHGSEEDFKTGALEAGKDYYLVKPVNIKELIAKIESSLNQ